MKLHNMTLHRCCCLAGLLLLLTSLSAQSVEPADPYLDLIEVSTNTKYRDTLHFTHGIVDLESELLIRLDRAEIEEGMLIMQGAPRSDARLQQLRRLNQLLDLQKDIMKQVNALVQIDQAGGEKPFEKIQALARNENLVYEEIQTDTALFMEIINRQEEYLNFVTANPQGTFIEWVFDLLTDKAESLRQGFLQDLGLEANADSSLLVYFRLGAFVQNRQGGYPIHVENFDTYSPEQYSQSLTFSQPISSDEKEALQENTRAGQQLQQEFELGKLRFQELLQSSDPLFASRPAYDSLKQMINGQQQMMAQAQEDPDAVAVLNRASIDLQQVEFGYDLVRSTFGTLTEGFTPSESTVRQLELVLGRLQTLVDTAYGRYQSSLQSYRQTVTEEAGQPRLDQLSKVDVAFSDYQAAVREDVSLLRSALSKAVGLLHPLKKNYLANDRFTEQVQRFTLGNLPPEGILTLKTAGVRPGDDVIVKAVLQRGRGPADRFYEEQTLSRRVIRIERVSPHIKMSGSLILANPYNPTRTSDTVALASNFQFAPSYTIFVSWGSRKSRFYNQFIGLGLGLGFSSPDFNLDGTPEFGASVMATMFQDIVSAGWGWNFGVDTPYWYLGFNIPFTVGGIPNLGTSQAIER